MTTSTIQKYRLLKLNDRLYEIDMLGEYGERITVGRFWDPVVAETVLHYLNIASA